MGQSQPVLQCDDCVTTFNSQMQMTQHLTSSKHIKKVQKKQITHVQFRGQERGRRRGWGRARGGNIKRPRSNNLIISSQSAVFHRLLEICESDLFSHPVIFYSLIDNDFLHACYS